MRRRSSRGSGTLPSRPISTAQSRRYLRNGYLYFFRASAQFVIALFGTAGFWLAMAPSAGPQTIDQMVKLLGIAPPWRRQLEPIYKALAQIKEPIAWPAPETEIEEAIFVLSALIFVQPSQSERARQILRQALGGRRFEYLLALLAFIRTAHYWTEVHPGLEIEDDVRELMSERKELASLILQDPDIGYRLEAQDAFAPEVPSRCPTSDNGRLCCKSR